MIEVITAFATVVLAIVAILALGVSIWMAWQNSKLIRMYREPSVIVYLKLDDYNPGLQYICVENVGNGPAHDISFHLSDKSLSMPIDNKKKLGDIDFVKKGMKLLAAGQDHTHFFQSTYDGFKIEPFEVRVEYYDSNNNRYGYKDKPFELDPSQFDKVWLDNHPLVAIEKELKAIREKGFGVFDNNIAKVLKDTSTTLKQYLEYKAIGQHVRQLPKGTIILCSIRQSPPLPKMLAKVTGVLGGSKLIVQGRDTSQAPTPEVLTAIATQKMDKRAKSF